MIDVRLAHTSSLDPETLGEIRRLLDEAFDGDFGEDDWDHTLGGMHALIVEDEAVIAHGAVVQRRLVHCDRPYRAGYVEGVAVRSDRRRMGYGRAVMRRLDGVIRRAYELGGLSAGEEPSLLYRTLGWRRWEGRTWVIGPNGLERTPGEDATTYVLPLDADLEFSGDLACDWRAGDVW